MPERQMIGSFNKQMKRVAVAAIGRPKTSTLGLTTKKENCCRTLTEKKDMPETLRSQGLGDAHKGDLWCVPHESARWFSLYVEQWRKPNGEVDVTPFGIPNLSFTFLMSELHPVETAYVDERTN